MYFLIDYENVNYAGLEVHNPMRLDMQTTFICAPEPVPSGQAFHFDLDAYSGI